MTFNDGKPIPMTLRSETYRADLPGMYSLCSEKWREDASKALLDACELIEKMPFADRVAGYFLAEGGTYK